MAEAMFEELAESIVHYALYVHGLYDIDAPRRDRTNDPSTAMLVCDCSIVGDWLGCNNLAM